jgi:hypothetical protein
MLQERERVESLHIVTLSDSVRFGMMGFWEDRGSNSKKPNLKIVIQMDIPRSLKPVVTSHNRHLSGYGLCMLFMRIRNSKGMGEKWQANQGIM